MGLSGCIWLGVGLFWVLLTTVLTQCSGLVLGQLVEVVGLGFGWLPCSMWVESNDGLGTIIAVGAIDQ